MVWNQGKSVKTLQKISNPFTSFIVYPPEALFAKIHLHRYLYMNHDHNYSIRNSNILQYPIQRTTFFGKSLLKNLKSLPRPRKKRSMSPWRFNKLATDFFLQNFKNYNHFKYLSHLSLDIWLKGCGQIFLSMYVVLALYMIHLYSYF